MMKVVSFPWKVNLILVTCMYTLPTETSSGRLCEESDLCKYVLWLRHVGSFFVADWPAGLYNYRRHFA